MVVVVDARAFVDADAAHGAGGEDVKLREDAEVDAEVATDATDGCFRPPLTFGE